MWLGQVLLSQLMHRWGTPGMDVHLRRIQVCGPCQLDDGRDTVMVLAMRRITGMMMMMMMMMMMGSRQAHYARQRRYMLRSAETHLTGLATWGVPKAGMFIWFKVSTMSKGGLDC
jgi:hypothetical protein